MSNRPKPVALVILDGWGLREPAPDNAVTLARKPNFDRIWASFPRNRLHASGLAVGLPEGQMGNSEVGHLNLGAGRVVYQDFTRIGRAIADGAWFTNPALVGACDRAREAGGALHLFGLLSDGGVHSHIDHLVALVELARRRGVERLFIHAFLDGRDTSPMAGAGYLAHLEAECRRIGLGRVATLGGRYYAMDRDKRWDRVEKAWRAMVRGEGREATSAVEAARRSYAENVTDEFVIPCVIRENGRPVGTIGPADVCVALNYRADRMREICRALMDAPFDGFDRGAFVPARLTAMCEYWEGMPVPVAFPPHRLERIYGAVLSSAGLKQLRIAETEKYAHVTYFFNGGEETPFPGEDRCLIPSPKVATYDLQPEMSAPTVADEASRRLASGKYDACVLNFANPDMVGHTGVLAAAVKAVEAVDAGLGRVLAAIDAAGGVALVTADHGNCEVMIDPATGGPHTAHTTNPVPLVLVDPSRKGARLREGKLADIAPTLLGLLGVEAPPQMEGRSLIERT